ncbi:PIN domain-containing protein [Bacillus albus]|uniref:PIN domain-containing protein n=1 Tax=Bacillus albus TaxID=2026189 RepID=A0A1J9T289_9BACI|nr:PIN domain-containing protein [Bacillus albus]OJD59841.1 hypothetical protein BAU25_17680 [Bacillus albus]
MSLPYVHSLNNATTINSLLYTDTSFIWESHGTNNGATPTRQVECHNFSTRAVQQGSVFVLSPIIEHELRNVALKELLKKHARMLGCKPHERKKIISNVPTIMQDVHSQVDNIMAILSADPNYVILGENAGQGLASQVSSKYNMDLNDSIILATMLSSEIDSIVTLDGDYIEVTDKDLQIYTNEANYLKILRDHPTKVANNISNNSGSGNAS